MKRTLLGAALSSALMLLAGASASGQGQTDSNPAMNAPDELAWRLYVQVNTNAGGSNVEFETWASDTDTFRPNPVFPSSGKSSALALHAPALLMFARIEAQKKHQTLPAIPPGGDFSEESRRNLPTFKFIVDNDLYRVSGLQKAFGKILSFPKDSMEVKANWIPIADVFKDTTYRGTIADIPKFFHVNTAADKKQYVLVSMHIISKQVPNWTWATFENRFNPKRCDIIGCMDTFGTQPAYTPANAKDGQGYPDCAKTPALANMITGAKLSPAFSNYCLKGTQIDFTDNTGLATRLGNSVTEKGHVATSSCITCHGMAGWDSKGNSNDINFVLGPLDPKIYWSVPTPTPATANYPFVGMKGPNQSATSADFVWAIPFCAYDDVTDPKNPQPSSCIAGGS